MEIQFLHEQFTEKDPKLLIDHIQRMASGEAPFFSTTLSLVYDKLVEKAFTQQTSPGSRLEKSTGGQSVTTAPPLQPSTPASGIGLSPTSSVPSSSSPQVPAPVPGPILPSTFIKQTTLKCVRCFRIRSIHDLYDGLYCPVCPPTGRNGKGEIGWAFLRCTGCSLLRETRGGVCLKLVCGGRFT